MCRILLLWSLLCFAFPAAAQRIIPAPASVRYMEGRLYLNRNLVISGSSGTKEERKYLRSLLGTELLIPQKEPGARIRIKLLKVPLLQGSSEEAYHLKVNKAGVEISAASEAGVFYGIQTLRQLFQRDDKGLAYIDYLEVDDSPRFSWREFMLDEARYFKGKAVVKQLLDEMALLKMNVFHWHLTDNTGWRMEIKKYPLLTAVGSKRDSSEIKINGVRGFYDGKPHEGFYTQEEIREIIQYAAKLHIVVVPEIDMPGHTSAAIAAYPWLGSVSKPISVPASFANQANVLNVTDPKVIAFAKDVLDEVMQLFPAKYIHIGGDEVKFDHWRSSARVMQFIQDQNLASPADLQLWFINQIGAHIQSRGRVMVGWNEILGDRIHQEQGEVEHVLSSRLAAGTVVDFWKGDLKLMNAAASRGYFIINSLNYKTYMDIEKISLSSAYSFNPVPAGMEKEFQPKIMGTACHMWSEWVPTIDMLHERIFPKLAAYAEMGWSNENRKSYADFRGGLKFFYKRWQDKNIACKIYSE